MEFTAFEKPLNLTEHAILKALTLRVVPGHYNGWAKNESKDEDIYVPDYRCLICGEQHLTSNSELIIHGRKHVEESNLKAFFLNHPKRLDKIEVETLITLAKRKVKNSKLYGWFGRDDEGFDVCDICEKRIKNGDYTTHGRDHLVDAGILSFI